MQLARRIWRSAHDAGAVAQQRREVLKREEIQVDVDAPEFTEDQVSGQIAPLDRVRERVILGEEFRVPVAYEGVIILVGPQPVLPPRMELAPAMGERGEVRR